MIYVSVVTTTVDNITTHISNLTSLGKTEPGLIILQHKGGNKNFNHATNAWLSNVILPTTQH